MAVLRRKGGAAPEIFVRQVYYPGDVVFEEGAPANCAYYIECGRVSITRKVGSGNHTLGTLRRGSIVGEMALIDNAPRMATVRAVEQTTLMQIDRKKFKEKIDGADPFIQKLLRFLVRNVRSVTDQQVATLEQSIQTEDEEEVWVQ